MNKAIGGISALIAGFAVVVLTNVNFPSNIDATLLCLVAFVTAAVVWLWLNFVCNYMTVLIQVGAMLISMLSSTFLLVAVYRYDCYKRQPHTFAVWWKLL